MVVQGTDPRGAGRGAGPATTSPAWPPTSTDTVVARLVRATTVLPRRSRPTLLPAKNLTGADRRERRTP